MTDKDDKKYKLSVYLAKESFKDDSEIMTKLAGIESYGIKDGKGELGILYVETGHPSVPKWVSLFNSVLSKKGVDLTTKSARAILIANVRKRKLCLTLGMHIF
jgi:uncharacterized protein (TIGR04141 family)